MNDIQAFEFELNGTRFHVRYRRDQWMTVFAREGDVWVAGPRYQPGVLRHSGADVVAATGLATHPFEVRHPGALAHAVDGFFAARCTPVADDSPAWQAFYSRAARHL